jgi:hypothetical protein
VNNGKMAAEKFLGPAMDLVDLTVVFEDLLHCAAVAEPIKVRAPKVFAALADRPATSAGFANKGMVTVLTVIAAARANADGSETGAAYQEVKEIVATLFENGQGGERVGSVGRLHEDVADTDDRERNKARDKEEATASLKLLVNTLQSTMSLATKCKSKWKRKRKRERDRQRRRDSDAQVACEYIAVDNELGNEM